MAMATTSVDSPKSDPDTNTELDTNPNLNPNPNSSNPLVPASSNGPAVCLLKFVGDSAGYLGERRAKVAELSNLVI